MSKFMQMSAAVEIGITKVWGGGGYHCWEDISADGYNPVPSDSTPSTPPHFQTSHQSSRSIPSAPSTLLPSPVDQIFHSIFEKGCIKADGSRALFVDVGGNFGWYTVVAAVMGCRCGYLV